MAEGAFERRVRMRLEDLREHADAVRTQNDAAMLVVAALAGLLAGDFVHVTSAVSHDVLTVDVLVRVAPHHLRITQPIGADPLHRSLTEITGTSQRDHSEITAPIHNRATQSKRMRVVR